MGSPNNQEKCMRKTQSDKQTNTLILRQTRSKLTVQWIKQHHCQPWSPSWWSREQLLLEPADDRDTEGREGQDKQNARQCDEGNNKGWATGREDRQSQTKMEEKKGRDHFVALPKADL